METVEQKVCLDTDTAIAILNGEDRVRKLLDSITNAEIFFSTVTLFELLLRETNLHSIETLREKGKLLEFNEAAARKASSILKELKKRGNIIDLRDLFIASICIAHECPLATFNKKHFERIKEFGLRLL